MPVSEKFAQSEISDSLAQGLAASGLAVLALFVLFKPVSAADLANNPLIIECGADTVDEFSLAECVTLKLSQAEATLEQAEKNWQSLLEEGLPPADDILPQEESAVTKGLPTDSSDEAESSNVIAIVNDTALRAGVSTRGNPVINVDDNSDVDDPVADSFDASVDIKVRFGFLPALFRSYRDQQCAWQASLFGSDRARLHYQACLALMSQVRAQELTRYLSVQRARAKSGKNFRGYYVKTDTGAMFQACNRRTDWWVTGPEPVLSAIDRRFLDIKAQSVSNNDLLYAEIRGEVVQAPVSGPGADFRAALSARSIGLLRPAAESDCTYQESTGQSQFAAQEAANSGNSGKITSAATVDDYASSGFLYGYFNYWLAACSVTENSVCSAETDAQFASDGDWQVRIDRSLEGDWRVKLVPTTDDQLIEKQLTMQINGTDVFLDTAFAQPLRLGMKQGVEIASGESAREIIAKLKQGRELRLQWFDDANVMSELKFSLAGVTRALEYFDSDKS